MHRIWFHTSVFLIRPIPQHMTIVILKISIFQFADPNLGEKQFPEYNYEGGSTNAYHLLGEGM